MTVSFEYKNMSFEKVDGIWIHKDWALPGDFGDIFDKPASDDLAEKVELAYQVSQLEKKLLSKETSQPITKEKKYTKRAKKESQDMALDFTKPHAESEVPLPPPKVKKTQLKGFFNPFDGMIKL